MTKWRRGFLSSFVKGTIPVMTTPNKFDIIEGTIPAMELCRKERNLLGVLIDSGMDDLFKSLEGQFIACLCENLPRNIHTYILVSLGRTRKTTHDTIKLWRKSG